MDRDTAQKPQVVIRTRTAADLPGAAAALVAVHATDGYPVEGVDEPEAWLTPPGLIHSWVAEIAGNIVGHISMNRPQDEAAVELYLQQTQRSQDRVVVLARLFVHPAARGHSIGALLIREAATYARSHGLILVGDVMTKDTAAIRLYERIGARQIGTTMHRYGDGQQTPAICYTWSKP